MVVAIVTDNPNHYRKIVEKLTSLNPDVKFQHIYNERQIVSQLKHFDKRIHYCDDMWAESFHSRVYQYNYLHQKVREIFESFKIEL